MRITLAEQLIKNHSPDKSNENLSNKLSLLMKENNISESDLARALKLPYNTIHRLISGHTTDPRISTLKAIANYFNVSLDSLFKEHYLLFDKNKAEPEKTEINEALLHYILKQSHHLYPISPNSNDDYADFVLGLFKEIRSIDTSNENLLKIIDLAIGSVSSYEETRNKHNHAI